MGARNRVVRLLEIVLRHRLGGAADGVHTYDVYQEGVSRQKVGTREFAEAVVQRVGQVPQSTHLYMVQVYQEFFTSNRFGYGSAMLWVYFLVILAFTLLIQRSSRSWVHYQVDTDSDR